MKSLLFSYRSNVLYDGNIYTYLKYYIVFREFWISENPNEIVCRRRYKCDYTFTRKFKLKGF